MKEKNKLDIMAKMFLFFAGLKEEKKKEYSSIECERNAVYLFDSFFEFRNYFESNTKGVIDDELLEKCVFKTTKKGSIIAFKGLCDYAIRLINSNQLDDTDSLEDSVIVIEETKDLGDEKIMVMDKMVEQVRKDEIKKIDEKQLNSSIMISEKDREFVKNIHELLLNGQGMVLLKSMSNERSNIIHTLVNEYSDMVSFSVGEGELKYVVLRYKPYVDEKKNIEELIKLGNLAYKEGNYDACIAYYSQLLQIGNPRANVYAKLGLAYMKKKKKDIAIDYLTVANELNKEDGKDFDFDDLIAGLKGDIPVEDRKPRFKMNVEEFGDSREDNYGIENIDEITSYILDSRLDVVSSCLELGMTYEQIDIVRLVYAREFYLQGNVAKGDQFLKAVEMSKNKTKFTLKLLEEIKRNKKVYINRPLGKSKNLSLALQPKK